MDGPARAVVLVLAIALVTVRAHMTLPSHDNILRIQLWDAEGLIREPIVTDAPKTVRHKTKVDLSTLYDAMMGDEYEHGVGRYARHKVRHKRRRPRQSGTDLPWRFHSGSKLMNVAVYDDDVPWDVIEGSRAGSANASAVSVPSASYQVNEHRDVSPPMRLRQDEDEEVKKELPVVPKCCASGQNLSVTIENGKVKTVCARSSLTFQPIFHKANETHIWSYDSNVFETIVGNPCAYDRYKLEPDKVSEDEFYLLFNGSLFMPFSQPPLLGTRNFCMETFWNESNPAGVTLPLLCFQEPIEEAGTSPTLIAYAIGLIISVPFLLATTCVYLFITELRDTHGKALACHSLSLAVAFSCLAATQLAGHAFPNTACTIMAYLIQFSFVSCFFWLNVMCFDTYLNVRRYINASVSRRSMRRRFAWYCAYAVLLPVLLLIVTITMDLSPAVPSTYLKPNFGVKGCWFKTDQAALPYFYGPVAVILLSNLIIFFLTSRAFARHYNKLKDVSPLDLTHSDFSTSDDWVRLSTVLGQPVPAAERSPTRDHVSFNQRLKKYKKIFRTCCLLSVIMGLSWVLEVVSWAAGAGSSAVSVWSVFDLINALQGVVIFAIYVLQQPVRTFVKFSKLCSMCRRKKDESELSVVSDRNSMCGTGRRDFV
ncbi:G-protein coupled receptor Mth2-like isoform X2 [Colias croceus]|uniref:G-protein coupled receptor Mth2-like isoform X2 n=1 Tax=Colias crocea TaxID=72248 RepID=UPI001E27FF05|nr:G-protein coupled receptor Mth2-like isoform X2 [Colias croceus]